MGLLKHDLIELQSEISKTVFSIKLVLLVGIILAFQFNSMQRDRKFASFIVEYTREMIHELKTPVSGVQMLLQMLQADRFSSQKERDSFLIDGVNMSKKIGQRNGNVIG